MLMFGFNKFTNIMNHEEQNVTLIFKIKGQDHSVTTKSAYFSNYWSLGVDFDTYIIIHVKQNVT